MAATQSQRKVLILGLVAGALALAYALGLVFSPTNVQKRRAETPLLPEFKPEAVARIEASGAGGQVRLSRADKERWNVLIADSAYPASSERVQSFFDHLSSLRRSRVVSANPESWKSFGVGDDAASRLRLADASDKTVVGLIVGNEEEGGRGSFVRLEGGNEVLLLNKSLGFYLDSQPSFWSHLRFFPAELTGADITRISVRADLTFSDQTRRRVAYTLIQSKEGNLGWKVVEPAGSKEMALDDKEVDRMATTLAGFEGSEFVTAPAETGLSAPSVDVLFSTADNKDYRILIGAAAGDDQYYAKLDGGPYLYLTQEWRVKMISQPLEDLAAQTETVTK